MKQVKAGTANVGRPPVGDKTLGTTERVKKLRELRSKRYPREAYTKIEAYIPKADLVKMRSFGRDLGLDLSETLTAIWHIFEERKIGADTLREAKEYAKQIKAL